MSTEEYLRYDKFIVLNTVLPFKSVRARITTAEIVLFLFLQFPIGPHTAMFKTSRRRPFMARMVAQKNSRGFQSTLLEREHILDKHILGLLEKFSDPSFFKKKHGYNVHGQMLGKDGKMIIKVSETNDPRDPPAFRPVKVCQVYLCITRTWCLLFLHGSTFMKR